MFSGLCAFAFGQHEGHNHGQHDGHDHSHPTAEQHVNQAPGHPADDAAHDPCATGGHHEKEFNAGDNAVHHIADANAFHIFGDYYFHLPVLLKDHTGDFATGWKYIGSSSKFQIAPHSHGSGSVAIDRFLMHEGQVKRVQDNSFPTGQVVIGNLFTINDTTGKKPKEVDFVCFEGKTYRIDKKSTLDGGVMGGGITSFTDFSLTKNVFTMLLTCLLVFLGFRAAASAYQKRDGQAPRGLQNFLEPLYLFVRDDIAKPNIGPRYEKYMPYLMSAFFFILGLNLIGQIPLFPGSANVTGNISITLVLAVITFLITNLSGNRHYWEHIVWMPGVPAILKILLITPIEILGVFLKPITLLLRLFANISAGHIVILSFVSLIFILGKAGESVGGSIGGAVMAVPLTIFMSALELLVAFLQAYIFTMLSATYIGSAIEEHHHAH